MIVIVVILVITVIVVLGEMGNNVSNRNNSNNVNSRAFPWTGDGRAILRSVWELGDSHRVEDGVSALCLEVVGG